MHAITTKDIDAEVSSSSLPKLPAARSVGEIEGDIVGSADVGDMVGATAGPVVGELVDGAQVIAQHTAAHVSM
jgi:hypothetical protein